MAPPSLHARAAANAAVPVDSGVHPAPTTPLRLYGFWRTSATYRVRVALHLKGLGAEEVLVNLDAGEQRSPEYLRINPLGGIPTLVHAGHPPLTQSLAILEFLEEWQPTPPLLPANLHDRAWVRSVAAMLACDTHPLITPRVRGYLRNQHGFDDADWKAWQTQWFGTGLAAVEQRLATDQRSGTCCLGNTVTLADICLVSVVITMRVFQVEPPPIPTIDRIVAHCLTLDAFVRAAPLRQLGAPASAT